MSDKGGEQKIETVGSGAPRRSFGQKVVAHYKKWWWVHLIILVVVVLVVTLPLVYVGFPNIAQHDVNDATLTISSQIVTDATPDSVHIQLESVSHSDSQFHPQLDSFKASLALADSDDADSAHPPFGYITVPGITSGSDVPISVDQTLKITNHESFTDYNIAVLSAETFYVCVSGDLNLHEGGLPTTSVDYNKVVEMKGLNALKGFKLLDVKANLKAGVKRNVHGKVFIPNPSVLTISLGTVTLDLSVDGKDIGYSVIEDLTLKPGNNTFDMWGHTDVNTVTNLLIKPKYKDLILPIDIHGNSSVVNGKKIPYFSAAIQSNPLHTKLNMKDAI